MLALAEALGEPHAENLFAKADRVTPRVVNIILQHPTEWSELLEAAKDLRADHIENLKGTILVIPGNHDVATAFSPGTAIDAVVTPRKGKTRRFAELIAGANLGVVTPAQLKAIVEAAEKELQLRGSQGFSLSTPVSSTLDKDIVSASTGRDPEQKTRRQSLPQFARTGRRTVQKQHVRISRPCEREEPSRPCERNATAEEISRRDEELSRSALAARTRARAGLRQ